MPIDEATVHEIDSYLQRFMSLLQRAPDSLARRYLYGTLREMRYNVRHHLLPNYCTARDIDFVEIRDGEIVALVECKVSRSSGASWKRESREMYMTIADALGVPLFYIVMLDVDSFEITYVHEDLGRCCSIRVDFNGFEAFMKRLQSGMTSGYVEWLFDILSGDFDGEYIHQSF